MDKRLDIKIEDAIMEVPHAFSCGGRHFYLYPISFGKLKILQRQIAALGINLSLAKIDASAEALRIVKEKRREAINVIIAATCKTKDELFSPAVFSERMELFEKELTDENVASLLLYIFINLDKTDEFMKHLGLDKELERRRKVLDFKARKDRNSVDFGGMTLLGSFILPMIEAGMTYNEIIWERSYVVIRLALADKISSVFLTDKERKGMPASLFANVRDVIRGDDPQNKERIRNMDWR